MATETYLGDGLYVEFDGFQFVLKANDPMNPSDKVYLEPRVLDALNIFAKRTLVAKSVTIDSIEYIAKDVPVGNGCKGCALSAVCPSTDTDVPYCNDTPIIFIVRGDDNDI